VALGQREVGAVAVPLASIFHQVLRAGWLHKECLVERPLPSVGKRPAWSLDPLTHHGAWKRELDARWAERVDSRQKASNIGNPA
jgi:hypothetical protein